MKIYTEEVLHVSDEDQFKLIKSKYERSCHVEYVCSKCNRSHIGKLRYLTKFPFICGSCKSKIVRISKYGPSGMSKEGIKRLSDKQKANAKDRLDKTSRTKLNRYGDKNYNNPSKAIDTKIAVYGTLYDREKRISRCREKYGVDFYVQTDEFKRKTRQTCENFGVSWPSQLDVSRNNLMSTCISRYGVPCVLQSPEIRNKIKNTCVEKYGLSYAPSHFAPARSSLEDSILEFIDTLSIKYVTNNRTLLKGKEIDIYFPECKKAIEVQGTYWHADPRIYESTWYNKAKNMCASEIWEYDEEKKNSINNLGISIFYIWEIDWNSDNEKTKQRIKEFLKNG